MGGNLAISFNHRKDTMTTIDELDEFTRAYIECALWSSIDDNDKPLDDYYGIEDIALKTLDRMKADCQQFQEMNMEEVSSLHDEQAGCDFWLTRTGHGAGFWDGDWPEPDATRLTEASKQFGEFNLYVDDSGTIHSQE